MNTPSLKKISPWLWEFARTGKMRVPALIYGDRDLISQMDDSVLRQLTNVAALPGIVRAVLAMPDAHSGFGFPIGGVAAFDPDQDGVICMGGVGYDISCGVRVLHTGLQKDNIQPHLTDLMAQLHLLVPSGVGKTGNITLKPADLDKALTKGAGWAVKTGFGTKDDLERLEDNGTMAGADPQSVSNKARTREKRQMGTLGAGNHYLEIQCVEEVLLPSAAQALGLAKGDVLISVHCGSRGFGHQIGTDSIRLLGQAAARYGISIPDKELVCAPINSPEGIAYYQAMACGANYAMANRQVITHLIREAFERVLPGNHIRTLFEVSHNTCRREQHEVDGRLKTLFVHRKGATRAFGTDSSEVVEAFRNLGQPILVGGSMGTASYILAGQKSSAAAFCSTCHGSGRALSRSQALKHGKGRDVAQALAAQGILVRTDHLRGLAEEAPIAYKDIHQVVEATAQAGLAGKVARLAPLACLKG